jgi:hypothetical protein
MTIRQHAAAAAALALLLAPLALFAQETKKLTDSSVPATVSIADADYLYVVQGGVSKRGTAGQLRAVTDSHVANDLTIESSATIGTDSCVRIGDRDAATNAVQICRSSADDRLYHDTDADGTKDTGEEFIDQAGGSGTGEYDPDVTPSSCAACEEFEDDTEALTWEGYNLGTSSKSLSQDGAWFTPENSDATRRIRGYWATGPDGSATDWVVTAKWSIDAPGAYNQFQLVLLATGTRASPTLIHMCRALKGGAPNVLGPMDFKHSTVTAYSPGSYTDPSQILNAETLSSGTDIYLQMRYASASKGLTCAASTNGVTWVALSTQTLAAHPTTSMGWGSGTYSATTNGVRIRVEFWRARSDATGTTDPFPIGQ